MTAFDFSSLLGEWLSRHTRLLSPKLSKAFFNRLIRFGLRCMIEREDAHLGHIERQATAWRECKAQRKDVIPSRSQERAGSLAEQLPKFSKYCDILQQTCNRIFAPAASGRLRHQQIFHRAIGFLSAVLTLPSSPPTAAMWAQKGIGYLLQVLLTT
jgi:hypothetical protein